MACASCRATVTTRGPNALLGLLLLNSDNQRHWFQGCNCSSCTHTSNQTHWACLTKLEILVFLAVRAGFLPMPCFPSGHQVCPAVVLVGLVGLDQQVGAALAHLHTGTQHRRIKAGIFTLGCCCGPWRHHATHTTWLTIYITNLHICLAATSLCCMITSLDGLPANAGYLVQLQQEPGKGACTHCESRSLSTAQQCHTISRCCCSPVP